MTTNPAMASNVVTAANNAVDSNYAVAERTNNERLSLFNHNITIYERPVQNPTGGSAYNYFYARTRISDPNNPSQKKTKEFAGKSREEAISKAYVFLKNLTAAVATPTLSVSAPAYTFRAWADRCFSLMFRYFESTSLVSAKRYHNYLVNDLGEELLPTLTPERLQKTLDHLFFEKKLVPTSIHKAKSLMNRYLKAAVDEGQIVSNPAAHLSVPDIVIEHNDILTTEEIAVLIRECASDIYGNLILLYIFCAFRRGEGLGLSDEEVHEDSKSIVINQQFRDETKSIEKTKSKKKRTIYPPEIAFAIIRRQREIRERWKKENAEFWNNEYNLICTNPYGGPIGVAGLNTHLKAMCAKFGRPELHLHDLRRSSASIAMYLSNNPKAVQALLGHATLGTTFYYCDTTKDQMTEFSRVQNEYYTKIYEGVFPSEQLRLL